MADEIVALFYPEIEIYASDYVFKKGIEIEACSDQDTYFDWAKIRFTPDFQPKISLSKKDESTILLGYEGSLMQVFDGYVAKPYNSGGRANEIVLKDKMLLLEETTITNTFMDTTPQEMISYCVAKAGVNDARLSNVIYPSKKVVSICRKSVIEVIQEIHFIWRINHKFFFSGGAFHWGEKPEQEDIYIFEYGKNIISLERAMGLWELETVSMPFIKHSHTIIVDHPKVSGSFEVKRISFSTNETGFIRTVIYFGEAAL